MFICCLHTVYNYTYSQSTFAQPLANPVDPVLTAFDWILSYYTVLASQLEAVFVLQSSYSHGVPLLPVSDTEEPSVQATAFPAKLRSEWVSSGGTPAPYGVISHRSVPFLSLYTKVCYAI